MANKNAYGHTLYGPPNLSSEEKGFGKSVISRQKNISYRQVQSCLNCKNVFRLTDYDEEDELYCTLGAPKRPLCGSNLMKESFARPNLFTKAGEKRFLKRTSDWNKWRKDRKVKSDCVCDLYEKKEDKI